jgi:hypothetical protein
VRMDQQDVTDDGSAALWNGLRSAASMTEPKKEGEGSNEGTEDVRNKVEPTAGFSAHIMQDGQRVQYMARTTWNRGRINQHLLLITGLTSTQAKKQVTDALSIEGLQGEGIFIYPNLKGNHKSCWLAVWHSWKLPRVAGWTSSYGDHT